MTTKDKVAWRELSPLALAREGVIGFEYEVKDWLGSVVDNGLNVVSTLVSRRDRTGRRPFADL